MPLRTTRLFPRLAAATAVMALGGTVLATAPPASAAANRDGVCDAGEFCYYFNSNHQGSVSDFTGSVPDYATEQPSCYDFKGAGAGKGTCIKNAAASVWNRSGKTVRVYYNTGYAGSYQDFAAGAKGNWIESEKSYQLTFPRDLGASAALGTTSWATFQSPTATASRSRPT